METKTLICFLFAFALGEACNKRDVGNNSIICVCSKNNCDTVPPLETLSGGEYQKYTSSESGARFATSGGKFSVSKVCDSSNNTLQVNSKQRYQKIHGFGGAFTDSTGINLLTLSNETRNTLLRAYFSEEGIQYSMGRVPIGGTDFSTHGYTLDDVRNDFTLEHFALQTEDYRYKIPFILEALTMTKNNLKLFGSAWTAPAWMKTNNALSGIGFLNTSMYDVWGDYHLKFLQSYLDEGILFWGLTTGNEPANGLSEYIHINDMGWLPSLVGQWIAESLGPKIRNSAAFAKTKIMIVDDQRIYYPWIPRYILQNSQAAAYVDGCAVHYYTDLYVSAEVLSITHTDFPDKFILATEACEGSLEKDPVILGSWHRAENYINSILDDLNNWSTGWMDWNMALNLEGGPTYVKNYVDSPILVNASADEFYKQPMYYALGHFSKFLRPGAQRVQSIYNGDNNSIKQTVFVNPDGSVVVSIFNPTSEDIEINIQDIEKNQCTPQTIEKHSINTIRYK